jgi:ATP-dependent RNA helicase DeaD
VETFDAMLVFVRTKLETAELSERLEARGFEAAPLNGDIPQQQRERTIAALKSGKVDIVVATDVAARGLDVERISHVVNYDVPYDSESYIHRIGRTGRAGRSGEAILFIAPRERNMLRIIERATRQQITQMNLPSVAAVNEQRVARFKQRIADALAEGEAQAFRGIVEEFQAEHNVSPVDIASALASLLQGETPLLLPERPEHGASDWRGRDSRDQDRRGAPGRGHGRTDAARGHGREDRGREDRRPAPVRADTNGLSDGAGEQRNVSEPAQDGSNERPRRDRDDNDDRHRDAPGARGRRRNDDDVHFETFRLEVGHAHGVKPGNIVGAIANEAGLEGRHIGQVDIRDDHSFVDLPEGMPRDIFRSLQKVRVVGQELRISRVDGKHPRQH